MSVRREGETPSVVKVGAIAVKKTGLSELSELTWPLLWR